MFTSITAANTMSPRRVDIQGAVLSDFDFSSANVSYALLTTGEEQKGEGGPLATFNTWLLIGDGGDYEIRYNATGTTPAGDAINTWLSLSSSRSWSLSQSGVGDKATTGSLSIRLAANQVVLDGATLNLSVNVEA